VPTVAAFYFAIDLPTLFAVTVFISATGGLLLLFSWTQNRRTPSLALFGASYLFASAGAALLGARGLIPDFWSVCVGHALPCGAYGMLWAGTRCFEGRQIRASWIWAGATIWFVGFQFESLFPPQAVVMLESVILAAYALLTAREIWYARDRELLSRWPTLALMVSHSGFLLVRIPLADALTLPPFLGLWQSTPVSVMVFEALFTAFCLSFLRVAMSKERAELEQRRAALTDSLTGVANRRAFFDLGERLLQRAVADRRPAALLLFDLDRFKAVNDTAGHQAGDRVLKAFCDLVRVAVRPGDLFGRVGGEEFAGLLVNVSMAEALQIAERLRGEFAVMRFPGLAANVTVSVGVAIATETCRTLPALLATADRALYRAKAEGRNRVAAAPFVLIDTRAEAAHRATEAGGPAAIPAPVAG